MNKIKGIDIFDKGKIALEALFGNEIHVADEQFFSTEEDLLDGILSINGTKLIFSVLQRPNVKNALARFKQLQEREDSPQNAILILDRIAEDLGRFLRTKKLFYIDTIGNSFINLPDLKVFVEKREPKGMPIPKKRAFQKAGLVLIFHLLRNPDLLNKSYRFLATLSNISLAAVSYIMEDLRQDEYLFFTTKGRKVLANVERLVKRWAISYVDILKPKIHRGQFIALDESVFNVESMMAIRGGGLYLSGSVGAYSLNKSIKSDKAIVYTNKRLSELARQYRILPAENNDESSKGLELFEAFWADENNNEHIKLPLNKNYIADSILIYADLLSTKDFKKLEVADQILNKDIKERFVKNGFQW